MAKVTVTNTLDRPFPLRAQIVLDPGETREVEQGDIANPRSTYALIRGYLTVAS